MKNIFILMGLFCFSLSAIENASFNTSYVDSAIIEAADFEEDKDSVEAFGERIIDSLNARFLRISYLESGDTTLTRINTDTIGSSPYFENAPTFDSIRGNPDIDSISGNPRIDSIDVGLLGPDTVGGYTLTGAISGGSVQAAFSSVETDTLRDGASNDNLYLSTDNFTSPLKKFGFGKTALESWASGYMGLQLGDGGALWAITTGSEGESKNIILAVNSYYDGNYKRIVNDEVTDYFQQSGNHVWRSDTAATEDIAYTPTTRMSLSTTKLNVSVDTTNANKMIIDSVQLSGGSWFKNYVIGTFPCTLSGFTTTVEGTATYEKIGNNVTIFFPDSLYGISNTTTMQLSGAFPTAIKPTAQIWVIIKVYDNSSGANGSIKIENDNGWMCYTSAAGAGFTASGTKGLAGTHGNSLTYYCYP